MTPYSLALIQDICRLGAYIFKSTTYRELKTLGIPKLDSLPNSKCIKVEDSTRLYIIGFAVGRYQPMNLSREVYVSLDDTSYGNAAKFLGSASILHISTTPDHADSAILIIDGVNALSKLMSTIGVDKVFHKGASHQDIAMVFAPPMQTTPVESKTTNSLGRAYILECLEKVKKCTACKVQNTCPNTCSNCEYSVDNESMVGVYDAVIKLYASTMKQNKNGKCVRMADGTRKWLPMDIAEKLLKLPTEERK